MKDIIIRLHKWCNFVQCERGVLLVEYRTVMALIKDSKLYIRPNTRIDASVRRELGLSRLDIVSVEYEKFDEIQARVGNPIMKHE